MPDASNRFFLFIGNTVPEGAASHLKTAGSYYSHKKLDSGPENWESIVDTIEDPDLLGVIAKLNSHAYTLLLSDRYERVAPRLLAALGRVRHVIFIHETTLTGRYHDDPGAAAARFDDEYYETVQRVHFAPPPEETRLAVNRLLDEHDLNVVPYRTNAEVSVLASAFVEDNEKNLLFRIYVPAGRIYAAEAEKLLSLFRAWITEVQGQRVRQDGYRTGSGQVFELFGVGALTSSELRDQFDDFSRFLEQCVEDPDGASRVLTGRGVDPRVADEIVRRYGREARRLQLDIRQARESRLLSIRHSLESELIDVAAVGTPAWSEVERIVDSLVPTEVSATLTPAIARHAGEASPRVNVNIITQNTIAAVYGSVIQGLQGTANFGIEAQQLMQVIQEYGGADARALQSDVLELEDPDARPPDRLAARQRLKGFLFRLGGRVEDTALAVLQKYVESKIGLGPPETH